MAIAPKLPAWKPSASNNNNGNRSSINSSARSAQERTLNVTAFGNPLPIIYGIDRVGTLLSLIEVLGGNCIEAYVG